MPSLAMRSFVAAFVAVAAAAIVPAQEWKRLAEDLGHPERGEAAAVALLALGDKAVAPLQHVLTELDPSDAEHRDRLRAVAMLVDLLGEAAGPLAGPLDATLGPELKNVASDVLHALGSLAPHAGGKPWHEHFHRLVHELDDKPRTYCDFIRFAKRSGATMPANFEGAQKRLADDDLFDRELAAEKFAQLRDPACLDLLRDRLLDRERQPKGHDGLRHNGFPVPLRDDFRRRASDAMLATAPTDPRCAIAHAVRAVEHPLRSVRLAALQALAGFGPDAAVAVPELMTLATGTDATIAADALKVLGMAGKAAGPHFATLATLAESPNDVGRVAKSLVARLRAMGVTPPEAPTASPANANAVAKAARDLGSGDDAADAAAMRTLREHRELAFDALLARLRDERVKAPDAAVRLLAEFAVQRGDADGVTLRYVISALPGDRWHGPMMSSSSGGEGELRAAHYAAYGRIQLGARTSLPQLAEALADDNAMVRFAAAELLLAQRGDVAAATEAGEQARKALLHALTAAVPTKISLEYSPDNTSENAPPFEEPLRGAIALALLDADLPEDAKGRLFEPALRADAPVPLIVDAVRRYGPAATTEALTKAASDARPAAAAAAREVAAARSPGK